MKNPRDLALNHYHTFGREPFGYAIDPENDLVAVLRWIDKPQIDGFVKRLLEAVRGR